MIADLIFIFAMSLTVVLSISILYFLFVFESVFEESLYESSYKVFIILIVALIFHGFYHVSELLFGEGDIKVFFESISMVTFIAGVIILTKNALGAQISIGVNQKLAAELDKRTAELKHRTIQLAESNKLKQLLIDILSHDLLNSVAVIKGSADILLEESQDESVKLIKQNSEKLMEIIKNTTSLTRLDNIEMLGIVNLDIGSMLGDIIDVFNHSAAGKKISIVYKTRSYPAKANQIIEEVFSNLISNAIKYSPENSKVVVDVLDAGANWRVMVKDNGTGIATEDKPKIFRRFQRLKKEGVKGSGLGLAIAKRIVDLHGGEIWVEDNPEGGCIFNVTVPKA